MFSLAKRIHQKNLKLFLILSNFYPFPIVVVVEGDKESLRKGEVFNGNYCTKGRKNRTPV